MQAILIVLIVLSSALCAEAKKKSKHNRMALKDDLLAYYNFEQDPRLFPIHDQSGNGNHLTGVNFNPVPTPTTSLVEGKLGKAISFNGSNQSATVASGVNFLGQPFTFAFWYKPLSFSDGGSILTMTALGGVSTVDDGSGNFSFRVTLAGKTISPAVVLVLNQWYFLVFGYVPITEGRGRSHIFCGLDMFEGQKAIWELNPTFGSSFTVGGGGSHGVYDELAVWTRAVDAEELTAIYNDGDGLDFSEWDAVRTCKEIKCCDD